MVAQRYRLNERVDDDPYGRSLWTAVDTQSGDRVVLKLLLGADDPMVASLPAISAAASALRHPHIATVLDLRDGAHPFVVYEALDGQTLAQAIEAGQRFSPAVTIRLAQQLLWALEYAHKHGFCHGRITPRTILLTKREDALVYAKLLDFGAARGRGDSVSADLRAVGEIIYQMVSGEAPRAGSPQLSMAAPGAGLPGLLEHVLNTALGGPSHSFASATEMHGALQMAAAQITRPRTGRSARVLGATDPSMSRAMHEVHDYQTTEIAAIPLSVTEAIKRDATARLARGEQDHGEAAAAVTAAWLDGDNLAKVSADASQGSAPEREAKAPPRPARREQTPTALARRSERRASWLVLALLLILAGAAGVALLTSDTPTGGRRSTGPAPPATTPGSPMSLALASRPAGAMVARGAETLGKTPVSLTLAEGSHRLTLTLEGYEPQTLTVEALGAHDLSHTVTLTPTGREDARRR
ncbi:MAG: hypothetical protein CSA66_03280 [Proteobacteria bacterium]|nr:MAG: hypothetical protein CSA66_03280 [Pseudomonadota bacterium]